jgi:hypothetical protein
LKLQIISKIVIVTLWLATLAVALAWLFWKDAPFDPEPITVVLGLISTAITALLSELSSRLEEEEFSLPYALAYGYVNNFIEPLVSQLLMNAKDGKKPKVFIYMPVKLSELEASNIERILGKMRLNNYKDEVINLEFKEGRARDILTINAGDKHAFFDFPNTLLSLNSLIDYKIESRKNKFTDNAREEMAKVYIEKFRDVVDSLLAKKDLKEYIMFIGKDLVFEFD